MVACRRVITGAQEDEIDDKAGREPRK